MTISTSAIGDPTAVFLQVAAWDDHAGLFNYYMRVSGTWEWAGNSYYSLASPSRGRGCFDSHVNGSLVMKELKQPWLNWQSMNATIQLADDDPLRQNPLYQALSSAEDLENMVRAGISRWTRARLKRTVTADRKIPNADWLLRQLCTTTTVNLTSTTVASSTAAMDLSTTLSLPLSPRLPDVRHSYATAALRAGVAVKVVSERLGPSSVAFTQQVYRHVIPGMDAEGARLAATAILGTVSGSNSPSDAPVTSSVTTGSDSPLL